MPISTRKINYYIQVFIIIAILSGAIYSFLFLKTYFYPAITGSQAIFGLQKNIPTGNINIERFNELIDKINKKSSQETTQSPTTDPFK